MNEPQRGECRSCRRPILWVRTESGKPMPLDAKPRPDGNVVVRGGRAVYLSRDSTATDTRYVSHFATCAQGKGWRRSS